MKEVAIPHDLQSYIKQYNLIILHELDLRRGVLFGENYRVLVVGSNIITEGKPNMEAAITLALNLLGVSPFPSGHTNKG